MQSTSAVYGARFSKNVASFFVKETDILEQYAVFLDLKLWKGDYNIWHLSGLRDFFDAKLFCRVIITSIR